MPHRIALVGCGPWSEHILRDLNSLGAEVQVVARHESSRARAVQGRASRIVSSVSELHPADGIVIARETVAHAEAIFDCVSFGVPVFVEKPMTHSVESAAAIAAMSDAGARIFVMDKWRYHPGIEALADLARSQKYGKVVGLRCRRNWWGNPHSDVSALWIYVPHDLSIALEILGQISDPQYAIGDIHGGQVRGIQGVLGSHPWFSFESHSRSHSYERQVTLHLEGAIAVLPTPDSAALEIYRSDSLDSHQLSDPILVPVSSELLCFAK